MLYLSSGYNSKVFKEKSHYLKAMKISKLCTNHYYGRTLVTGSTLDRIAYEQAKMLGDPFHSEALLEKEMESLFQDSNVNSARLEADLMLNRDPKKNHSGRISRKVLERESRKIGSKVHDAWTWACDNYDGEVTEEFITNIAHIVDPISNQVPGLRSTSARLDGLISAISPEKLKSFQGFEGYLDRFLREVNLEHVFYGRKTEDVVSIAPLEKALYSHFMLFYLQPNVDANKRTARIVQNLILKDAKLPPPIIYDTENREYSKFLVDAFKARRQREGNPVPNVLISKPEHLFFEYMGKKALISLERLNDSLDKQKTFYVTITNPDSNNSPLYLSTKKALNSLISRRDPSGSARYSKQDECITARANMTIEDVEAVLDSFSSIKSYRVSPDKPFKP